MFNPCMEIIQVVVSLEWQASGIIMLILVILIMGIMNMKELT